MSEQELVRLLSVIRVAYPRFYANTTIDDVKSTVALWREMFKNDSSQDVVRAVKELIAELPYPPSIADIKNKIKSYAEAKKLVEYSKMLEENEKQERLMLKEKNGATKEKVQQKIDTEKYLKVIRKSIFGR